MLTYIHAVISMLPVIDFWVRHPNLRYGGSSSACFPRASTSSTSLPPNLSRSMNTSWDTCSNRATLLCVHVGTMTCTVHACKSANWHILYGCTCTFLCRIAGYFWDDWWLNTLQHKNNKSPLTSLGMSRVRMALRKMSPLNGLWSCGMGWVKLPILDLEKLLGLRVRVLSSLPSCNQVQTLVVDWPNLKSALAIFNPWWTWAYLLYIFIIVLFSTDLR